MTRHTIIIVPCFNEELRLQVEQFRNFASRNRDIRFIMVNDGSRDNTLEILTQLKCQQPASFDVLNLHRNVGKAEAVRRGCCLAFQQHPEMIGYWDADLAAPLEEVLQFQSVLDRRPEIEIVIGSRLALLGHSVSRGKLRGNLGRLFAFAASIVLGLRICDTQAGHKLFRVTDRLRDVFADPFLARWIFDVEIFARWIGQRDRATLTHARKSIYEFPLETWHEVAGSKLTYGDFARAAWELTEIAWSYLIRRLPTRVSRLASEEMINLPRRARKRADARSNW